MRSVTAILLAFTLFVGAVECKTACALDSCEKTPPCHHAQKTVKPCSPEIVLQRAPAILPSLPTGPILDAGFTLFESHAVISDERFVLIRPPLRI
jgi:hypothetical protein